MLIDLLKTKWNTFVKFRFYRQFILFSCYFLISLVCFTLRPGGPPDRTLNSTALNSTTGLANDTSLSIDLGKYTRCAYIVYEGIILPASRFLFLLLIYGPFCLRYWLNPEKRITLIICIINTFDQGSKVQNSILFINRLQIVIVLADL